MGYLGAELTDVAPGRVAIRLRFREELTQQDGFFHAGGAERTLVALGQQTLICLQAKPDPR
jgi:hypothetical protein